ncbi:dihydroflavonol-4-reductase [Cordyceps fumosorosea ARSEF 2679]|uniref:Dihydroflavonol-4-reductase n=1 Tax=Cordyceps fumosorosea (strain ARSEF 2679) TaxID=1081104 RepID=A0A162LGQ9_CORFA|nr:dihydroflavonol-4-reductase [Cordyceps fumosorosea ARSEF 2679]OAA70364.1 dihydroflavonol-4-reductase [Cordyceps fumosorosea ARSEF 2679]
MATETILLTGGSGFIAAHILEQLLAKGHTVITTVRTQAKADTLAAAYPDLVSAGRLAVEPVGDIAVPTAFDAVLAAHGPRLSAVLHTASPFHYDFTDPQAALLDPAVNGTLGILRAIRAHAPRVRRVVVTSSFAAILDARKARDHATVYTEASWNPNTADDVVASGGDKMTAYRVSKTLAERAAWDFVAKEKPGFDLATVTPPLVFGPVAHHLKSADAINTSNARVVALLRGDWERDGIPDTGTMVLWVDVRDVAAAHVRALELPEAGGRRLFVVGGRFDNRQVADVVYRNFEDRRDAVPGPEVKGGEAPPEGELFRIDNSATDKLLGIKWTSLEKSITDLVGSLKGLKI